ncbi:MAG: hypothetical protein AAGI48_09810 [Verrucomicrobiota bacterium]
MKHLRRLAPLVLILCGACAPKAILVEEADMPAEPAESKPVVAQTDDSELPTFGHNDGLLDPKGLATMPTEKDMRPTIAEQSTTVIANPPEGDQPTSE